MKTAKKGGRKMQIFLSFASIRARAMRGKKKLLKGVLETRRGTKEIGRQGSMAESVWKTRGKERKKSKSNFNQSISSKRK